MVRVREFGVLVATLVLAGVFSFMNPLFVTAANLGSLLVAASDLGIMSIGVTFLMISGEFDLSIGGPFTLAPMTAAFLIAFNGFDRLTAIAIGLGIAALMGAFNGVVVTKTGIPSFIITLGSGMIYQGMVLITSPTVITISGETIVEKVLNGRIGPIRAEVFWFAGIAVVFLIILEKTKYGNWVYGTGGNPAAALMAGIPVRKVKILNFIISSTLAGFSGILLLARIFTTNPTQGEGYALSAIAASVIGGTSLFGGIGSIIGGSIGAIITSMIAAGLGLVGVSAYWNELIVGLMVIIVVGINEYVSKGVARRGFAGS